MSLHRNLKVGMRIKYQPDGEMTCTGEILGRHLDCDDETVTYEVRESDGCVYGVSSCDVTEVL